MMRLLRALQPKLLVALAGSVFLFAPSLGIPSPAQENAAASSSGNSSTETGPSSTPEETSLLAYLFGKTAINPQFKLPDLGPPPATQDAAGLREPAEEPARSIYRYLVASSDIQFKADSSRLGLALATAEKGERTALDRLIADYEGKFAQFQLLAPPSEMQGIHEASLQIVLQHIQHLKAARAAEPGKVLSTWKSGDRSTIGEEAGRILAQMREIVNKYNIILPAGVLP